MRQAYNEQNLHHVLIVFASIFMLFFIGIITINNASAVTSATGTNASLILFDDGDKDHERLGTNKSPGIEVNRLFNDTTNVYFYANYTNGTGAPMTAISGTACAIEFEAGAGGNKGPFTMSVNTTLALFEYNRSFPSNGTFAWNATCGHTAAGTANITLYDSVRIFGPGCYNPGDVLPNLITNNTILCGGALIISSTTNPVFNITNNNITMDCNGSVIRGNNQGTALDIGPFNGSIITNCYFENYSTHVTTSAKGFKDNILLFNNSFANGSRGVNLTRIGNITIRATNFTNNSVQALYGLNVTNATIVRNRFCQNSHPTFVGENANVSFTNNTLCVTLVAPANNTDQNDINFTFNVPTFGSLARTCNLVTNLGQSGRVSVGATNANNVDVTLNRTFFRQDPVNWQVNCTDTNDNGDLSILFNTTYRACTIPTPNMTAPSSLNVTFCPGTFELNISAAELVYSLGSSNDTVTECNNTIFKGIGTGDLFVLNTGINRVKVQNCVASNFSSAVVTPNAITGQNVTFYNNSFVNMSSIAVSVNGVGFNFTNNSFMHGKSGLLFTNGGRHFLINNTIYNNTGVGIVLKNSTNNTIIANNISNSSEQGVIIDAGAISGLLATQPNFENLIANNTVCASGSEGLLINNTRFSSSPVLDGLVANNSFCNATTGNVNSIIAKLIWNYEINVVNATNTGIANANINITNNFSQNVSSDLTTNSTGFTASILNITQFIVNNSDVVVNYTPSYFVAAKNNEKTNLTFTLNQIRVNGVGGALVLNLSQDNTPPNVTQISPTSGTVGSLSFSATVVDQTGIQSCSLFAGTSVITNRGVMAYSVSTGIVSKTLSLTNADTYTIYANCTDNGGNIGFNSTAVSVSLVSGGGGDDGGDDGGGGVGGGVAPAAEPAAAETAETAEPAAEEVAAEETAAEQAAEGAAEAGEAAGEGDGKSEETEELEAEAAIVAEAGGVEITSIAANGIVVYENGEQVDTVTIKDEDILVLEITITNPEEGVAENLDVLFKNLPETIDIEEISPEIIERLEAGETQTIRIELESGDVSETFSLDIEIRGLTAYASVSIGTVLEGGKGKLYYTRQKIIEETREVVIRTYKILFLLFLVPILLLLRATTIVDENALRRMIDDKKLGEYWRVYVPEQSYLKYNMFQNLKPIYLEESEVTKANEIVREGKISYALATMILYANKKLIPRVFTLEKVPDEIRHKYPRVYFTSPLRDYREEQLQRYVEMQKKKGYKNNEIREALLAAKWDGAIIKKYLNPEEDLAQYIAVQQKQGKSLGEIRKELLDVKWDKTVVNKHIPREAVLKEYITAQRKEGKTNEQLRKELAKVGWEKELVTKYLNPENDLKSYIVSQQHLGLTDEQIMQKLIKGKWKKEIVEKIFAEIKKK